MSLRATDPVFGSANKSSRTTVERSGCVAVKLRSARAHASACSCQLFRATLKHRALCRYWNGATVITSTETIVALIWGERRAEPWLIQLRQKG
jgi:hypothetical protein